MDVYTHVLIPTYTYMCMHTYIDVHCIYVRTHPHTPTHPHVRRHTNTHTHTHTHSPPLQVRNGHDAWYLSTDRDAPVTGLLNYFTFLILYNVMVPISLYVSLELVKVAQVRTYMGVCVCGA